MSVDSKLASNIRQANLITWNEIAMCVKCCNESVDRTLRAIIKSPKVPFGRTYILFSGNSDESFLSSPEDREDRLYL